MAKRKLNETDEPSVVTEPQTQKKTKKSSTEKKEKKEKKSKSQSVKPQEEKPEATQQQEQQQTEEEQELEQQLKDEQKQQDEKDEKKQSEKDDADLTFSDLGLDPRLVQAVAKQSFEKPTLVQRKAIPLALAGQDVLCKAKTGSGKTAAYVLPVLSGILKRKAVSYLDTWEKKLREGWMLTKREPQTDRSNPLHLRPYPRPHPRTRRPSPQSHRCLLRLLHQGHPIRQVDR